MKMRVVVLLALVGCAFAVPKVQERIIGGSDTTIERYPYMANMQFFQHFSWWVQACGGSLITTTAVLSAAHCYVGDRAIEWRARLGTSDTYTGGSIHVALQLITHNQYHSVTADYDVAIVKLATPAILSESVGLARISGTNYNLIDGSAVTAIGWGSTTVGGLSSDRLQHVDINVINQEVCAERYAFLSYMPNITPRMMCAGLLDIGGKDTCQGDSGGPLVQYGDIVVGITSWGVRCAHETYPGVSARVSSLVDWILANA